MYSGFLVHTVPREWLVLETYSDAMVNVWDILYLNF